MKVSYFSNSIYRKKSKFGIKSFVLCDSVTDCIQDLIVYSWANIIISEDITSKSIGQSSNDTYKYSFKKEGGERSVTLARF